MFGKYITITIVCSLLAALGLSSAGDVPPRIEQFRLVDGQDIVGKFIDLAENDTIFARFSAIADSGIEVERVTGGKVVWRTYCKPLGVAHSIYMQQVQVRRSGKHLIIRSDASGGVFSERLDIADGKLVSRTRS